MQGHQLNFTYFLAIFSLSQSPPVTQKHLTATNSRSLWNVKRTVEVAPQPSSPPLLVMQSKSVQSNSWSWKNFETFVTRVNRRYILTMSSSLFTKYFSQSVSPLSKNASQTFFISQLYSYNYFTWFVDKETDVSKFSWKRTILDNVTISESFYDSRIQ